MSAVDTAVLNEVVLESLSLVLLLSAPVISIALLTSVIVGWLGHYTRLSEPAIGSLARLIAGLGGLLLVAPWVGARVLEFAQRTWQLISQVVS